MLKAIPHFYKMPSNLRCNYLADKNPTINKASYRELCKSIVAEDIKIICYTVFDDLVREGDILYRTSRNNLKIKS